MAEHTLNKIEEVKGIDLNYVDRITFYSHYNENGRDYETTGSMAYWNEEEFRWGAEIVEAEKIPKGDVSVEASIRYRINQWGFHPEKVNWETYNPKTFEEKLLAIADKRQSFTYSNQGIEKVGSEEATIFTAITVQYNTKEEQYTLIRTRVITGDPEAVRIAFVKYIKQTVEWNPVIKVYEQEEE